MNQNPPRPVKVKTFFTQGNRAKELVPRSTYLLATGDSHSARVRHFGESSVGKNDSGIVDFDFPSCGRPAMLPFTRLPCFFTVTLPAAKYGVMSACFVAFTYSITDFGAPKVIGGWYNVLSVDIYKQVVGQWNFQMGAVVSVVHVDRLHLGRRANPLWLGDPESCRPHPGLASPLSEGYRRRPARKPAPPPPWICEQLAAASSRIYPPRNNNRLFHSTFDGRPVADITRNEVGLCLRSEVRTGLAIEVSGKTSACRTSARVQWSCEVI